MSTTPCTVVALTDRQIEALEAEAERLNVPTAGVIRRWLDDRIDHGGMAIIRTLPNGEDVDLRHVVAIEVFDSPSCVCIAHTPSFRHRERVEKLEFTSVELAERWASRFIDLWRAVKK